MRVVLVLELTAGAEDDTPDLSNDLRPGRNVERVGDEVRAVVDEDDLAAGELVDDRLQCRRVIRLPVALGALVAHADELRDGEVRVLGACPAEDTPGAVQEAARLAGRGDVGLRELGGLARAREDVALAPAVNRRRATAPGEHGGSVGDSYSSRDVRQMDVVEDEST